MCDAEENEHPIEDLQRIFANAGEDVAKLFGSALTTRTGPFSGTKDDKQKRAELERLIVGN